MEEVRDEEPAAEEVQTAVDRIVNGFVFNFETPGRSSPARCSTGPRSCPWTGWSASWTGCRR